MTGQGRVREQQKNEKGSGREEAKEADKRLCKGKKDEKKLCERTSGGTRGIKKKRKRNDVGERGGGRACGRGA